MWLSAKTHGMRFPELFLGGHAEKKNVGGVRSGRVLCDRAEVRTLHQLCGPGAHHFRASLAGRVGVTRPGLHPPQLLTPCSLLPTAAAPGRGQQRLLHLRVLGGEACQIAAPPRRPPCT